MPVIFQIVVWIFAQVIKTSSRISLLVLTGLYGAWTFVRLSTFACEPLGPIPEEMNEESTSTGASMPVVDSEATERVRENAPVGPKPLACELEETMVTKE